MKEEEKTKEQILLKLEELQGRIVELEALQAEYKRTQETLRSLEKAIETMQIGVTITDTKGKIIYSNSADAKMHGYKVEELIGEDVRIFAPNKLWKSMTLEQLKKMKSWRRESLNVRKDGIMIPVQLMSDVVTNASGKPIGIVTTCEDITERKQLEKELEKLATTDILTQAYNRVKFEEIIGSEVERAKRYDHSLSVIMFDIDHFKDVNDTYGHVAGDYVLKKVADITRENMRKTDYLIRWGGEEFMIISPETDLEKAGALAERIREVIESFSFDKAGKITVSFGVTQFNHDDTEDTFLKRADDTLYKAKTNGRNRVEVSV